MPLLAILSEEEQLEFDHPPLLTPDVQAHCFVLTPEVDAKIKRLRTPTNKVGFLLQYGYFKICKRFFMTSRFRHEDIEYVAKILGLPPKSVDFSCYNRKTRSEHQSNILALLDYKPLDHDHGDICR